MNARKLLLGERRAEKRFSFQDIWGMALDVPTTRSTSSGEAITWDTAMSISAVYAAISLIVDNASTLSLDTYEWRDERRVLHRPFPRWLYLDGGYLNRIQILGQIYMSLLLDGDAYCAVAWDQASPQYLIPLDPTKVDVELVGMRKKFTILTKDGVSQTSFEPEILHIPGLMFPGSITGLSPIAYGAETMGISIASQKFAGSSLKNYSVPSGLISTEHDMEQEGVDFLRAQWRELHSGASNAAKIAILTNGAQFSKISLAPEEAQLIQTRQFQVADIARFFRVPPHLLADASQSTSWGSGLAEQNTAFAQMALRPWVERVQLGFTKLLQQTHGRSKNVHVAFRLDDLMRGSPMQQMSTYGLAIKHGIMHPEEVRSSLNLPPLTPAQKKDLKPKPPPGRPQENVPPPTQKPPPPQEDNQDDD